MHNRIRKSIAGILCMVTCITASVDTYAAENIHNFSSVRLQTKEALQYNTESMSDIESEAKETRTVSELESEESIISTVTSVVAESDNPTKQELETESKTDAETSAESEAASNTETDEEKRWWTERN